MIHVCFLALRGMLKIWWYCSFNLLKYTTCIFFSCMHRRQKWVGKIQNILEPYFSLCCTFRMLLLWIILIAFLIPQKDNTHLWSYSYATVHFQWYFCFLNIDFSIQIILKAFIFLNLIPLKDQQIDAKELQSCLTSSGISGNYHREYNMFNKCQLKIYLTRC